jgi:hypothetical protein
MATTIVWRSLARSIPELAQCKNNFSGRKKRVASTEFLKSNIDYYNRLREPNSRESSNDNQQLLLRQHAFNYLVLSFW